MSCSGRKSLFLSCAMGALFLAQSHSAANAAEQTYQFDIPAEPLGQALTDFSRTSSQQIVFSEEVTNGKSTGGVHGRLSAEAALGALLAGSNLVVQTNSSGVMMVRPKNVQAASNEGAADSQAVSVESVVVTGTHIAGEAPAGARILTITKDDIQKGGFTTPQDAVRSLSQNFNGSVADTVNGTLGKNAPGGEGLTNTGGANALNLRGLGADATLVLVDGRRLAPGGTLASYVDVSSIPMAALDHIEVLPDGASAIYGADAIGGVVNFVLKHDYSGAETAVNLGSITNGGMKELDISQTFGRQWGTGSVLVAADYRNRSQLAAASRPNEMQSDLISRGGNNFSNHDCNPGTIVVGGQTYAIPTGQNGFGLPASSLVAGTTSNCNTMTNASLYPDQLQYDLYANGRQSLGDGITLFADISFTDRRMHQFVSNVAPLSVPSTNAFYVNPTGGKGAVTVDYDWEKDLGLFSNVPDTQTLTSTFGASVELPGDWQAQAYLNQAVQWQNQTQILGPNATVLAAALANGSPSIAFDPFGDGSYTSPSTLANLQATRTRSSFTYASSVRSADVVANGTLFGLPGGSVKAAVGGEYREEGYSTFSEQVEGQTGTITSQPARTSASRQIYAAFAELSVPVVGAQNSIAGIRSLDVSLAGRFEHYSDFGSAAVPRVGLTWVPTESVSIRAGWSRSFRAPDLPQLASGNDNLFIVPVADPASSTGTSNALELLGGNANLKPETARSWSGGFSISPGSILPFEFSATYFNINFTNRIASALPSTNYLSDPADAFAVTRSPTAAQQAASCSAGIFLGNFGTSPGTCTTATIAAIINGTTQNQSSLGEDGLDIAANYLMPTTSGDYSFGVNLTQLFSYKLQSSPTSAVFDRLDTPYNPLSTKLRASAGWSMNGIAATAFLNYQGAYTDNTSTPNRPISDWITVDLSLAYNFLDRDDALDKSQISLTASNLFDQAPPFYNNPVGVAYDPANASAMGRFLLLSLRKSW